MNFAGPGIPPNIAIPPEIVKLLETTAKLTATMSVASGFIVGGPAGAAFAVLLDKLNRITGGKNDPPNRSE